MFKVVEFIMKKFLFREKMQNKTCEAGFADYFLNPIIY